MLSITFSHHAKHLGQVVFCTCDEAQLNLFPALLIFVVFPITNGKSWCGPDTYLSLHDPRSESLNMASNSFGWQPFQYPALREGEIRVLQLRSGQGREPLVGVLHNVRLRYARPHGIEPPFRSRLLSEHQSQNATALIGFQYAALSYVWGSELKPCVLLCSSRQAAAGPADELASFHAIPITASLDSILRGVRENIQNAPKYLWIDAVCINQENTDERNDQVLLMGDIYSLAERTFVCLGDDDNDVTEASRCMNNLCNTYRAEHGPLKQSLLEVDNRPWLLMRYNPGYISEKSWRCFERLLSRPWFSRVWIFQEVVLSANICILYKTSILSWENLLQACQMVEELHLAIESPDGQPLHWPVVAMEDAKSWKLDRDDAPLTTPVTVGVERNKWAFDIYGLIPLNRLLLMMRCSQATDARDKVYALLSISSGFDREFLRPNYSISIEDCYVNTAKALYRMRDTSPLAFLSYVQHANASLSVDLPSWCPDWRTPLEAPWLILTSESTFRKSFNGKAEFSFRQGRHILAVSGVSLMKIIGYERKQQPEDLALLASDISYPITNQPYSAILKKLIHPKPPFDSLEPNPPRGSFWAHSVRHGDIDLSASPLSKLYDSSAVETDVDIAAWDRANDVQGIAHGRRPFITNRGFIGFAPAASTIGDEICLLFEGKVLFVIRRERDFCRFVGECFVFGLMDGEAISCFDLNKVENFVLY